MKLIRQLILIALAASASSSLAQRESFDASTIRIVESKEIKKKLLEPTPGKTLQRGGVDLSGKLIIIIATDRAMVFEDVFFKFDSTELRNRSSELQLQQMADALKHQDLNRRRFLIEGHTCDIGGKDYNLQLSAKRAQAIKDALVKRGIAPERLAILGCGEMEPTVELNAKGEPAEVEVQRSRNRRVVLRELPVTGSISGQNK